MVLGCVDVNVSIGTSYVVFDGLRQTHIKHIKLTCCSNTENMFENTICNIIPAPRNICVYLQVYEVCMFKYMLRDIIQLHTKYKNSLQFRDGEKRP